MGWSEKLYAAIEPADPYLDDGVLIVSGRYLLGAAPCVESNCYRRGGICPRRL
jgi:hypothetical protein